MKGVDIEMEIENTVCIFPFENFQPLLVGVIFNQLKFYKVNNGFFKIPIIYKLSIIG